MFEMLGRLWRTLATALGFALFGLGGLVLRFIVLPVAALLVPAGERRHRVARALIRANFVAFVRLLRGLGILTLEVRGAERLQRSGALVLANHPTLIDVVLLMALLDNADCIVKASLWRNPFMKGAVGMAGFICNNGEAVVGDAIASVQGGSNLVIFPEGTRTPLSGEMVLQRGAANIAVRGGLDITPVLIHSEPAFLTKGAPWWRVPVRRVHLRVEVREDIRISDFVADAQPPALAARRLTRFLTDYFAKEVPRASA